MIRLDPAVICREILDGYPLPPDGIHGVHHWARVLENGKRLAYGTTANIEVVTLFSLFHDCRRMNDGDDPDHGLRGAELAASLRGSLFDLGDGEFRLLHEACSLHTAGLTEADFTIQVCWDADRLDLARVGVDPAPGLLCTAAARSPEVIAWASARAESGFVPPATERWLPHGSPGGIPGVARRRTRP